MHTILAHLLSGQTLSESQAESAINAILTGQANESQVGALLALLATRLPTTNEIVGAARSMRAHVTPVPFHSDDNSILIDTCGTGGTAKTFNISTAAAVIAAAAGELAADSGFPRPRVAKHGGRSRSGRGSAEVLAALGVNIDASPQAQSRCLREIGLSFSFALNHHPAMKFAAGPRKSLGFPTLFNILGPLCNPAGARHQLIGIYDPALAPLIAQALARLGSIRVMVVHGAGHMDELSTLGISLITEITPASPSPTQHRLDPSSLGLPLANIADLTAHSLPQATQLALDAIEGRPGPPLDIALLNAAAALLVAGAAPDLPHALDLARHAALSGHALRTLHNLARLSNEP